MPAPPARARRRSTTADMHHASAIAEGDSAGGAVLERVLQRQVAAGQDVGREPADHVGHFAHRRFDRSTIAPRCRESKADARSWSTSDARRSLTYSPSVAWFISLLQHAQPAGARRGYAHLRRTARAAADAARLAATRRLQLRLSITVSPSSCDASGGRFCRQPNAASS